jgi:hypothetical protein
MSNKPFKLTAFVPPEDELHQALYQALRVLLPPDAVFNTFELRNAASVAEGARRKRLGALPGWPDCAVFYRGKVVLIELKRSRDGHLSPAQQALHPRLAEAGFPVQISRTVEHALAVIEAAGVPLRGRVAA